MFLFRRCRGQPSGLVRARSPALFLSAAAAIFQVGARVALSSCTPHTLREEFWPRRLRVRVVGRLSGGHWPGWCVPGGFYPGKPGLAQSSLPGVRLTLSLSMCCRDSTYDSVWVLTMPGRVHAWSWLGRGGCPPGQPGNDVMGTPPDTTLRNLQIWALEDEGGEGR